MVTNLEGESPLRGDIRSRDAQPFSPRAFGGDRSDQRRYFEFMINDQ